MISRTGGPKESIVQYGPRNDKDTLCLNNFSMVEIKGNCGGNDFVIVFK